MLTQAWAGTFTTQLLGFLGAEVIQVEARQRLDSWRGGYGGVIPAALQHRPEAVHPWNVNPLYNSVNLNKQTITLTSPARRDARSSSGWCRTPMSSRRTSPRA